MSTVRYWVGGTGTWDGTTTHWSASSGGAGGATVPTAAVEVQVDGNSGSGTITVSGTRVCRALLFTGSSITALAGASTPKLSIGDATAPSTITNNALTLEAGVAVNSAVTFNFISTSTTQQPIAMAGQPGNLTFAGAGGKWTFADALTGGNNLTLTNGEITLGSEAHSLASCTITGSSTRSFIMSGPTLSLTGTVNIWGAGATTGLTFTHNNSTIAITDTSSTQKTFSGGGLTYAKLQIAAGGTGVINITPASGAGCTFSSIERTGTGPISIVAFISRTITLNGGTSNDFLSGTSGNLVTIASNASGTAFTLSSSTSLTTSWIDLKDCAGAGGGIPHTATNSTNSGGNSNWTITPPPSSSMFLMFSKLLTAVVCRLLGA